MAPSLAEIWLEAVLGPKPAHFVEDVSGVCCGSNRPPLPDNSVCDGENSGNIGLGQNALLNEFVDQGEHDNCGGDAGPLVVRGQIDVLHDVSPSDAKSSHGKRGTSSI